MNWCLSHKREVITATIYLRMCFGKLSVLLLLIFSFASPEKLCRRHSPINVIENEYFSNCCPSMEQDEGYTVNWYREKEGKWMAIQEDSRTDLNGTYLRFWPAVLNDTGNYNCCISNRTQVISCYKWFLKVLQRNKNSCFNADHVVTGISGIVGRSYMFKCDKLHMYGNIVNIMWYKNCTRIVNQTEEEWHINQLKAEDAGKYTCVASFFHGQKIYNSTHTISLTVKGAEESTRPMLIGPHYQVYKTEIGKEEILNCTVFLGYSNISRESNFVLYWVHDNELIDPCQDTKENISPCLMKEDVFREKGGKHVSKRLWIKSVKEEDINSSYTCVFSFNGQKPAYHVSILQKETNPDLPVHTFTTGILMAILFSFAAVFSVILCAAFKVDLVLLYRDITGKDETLGDGKIYDAFVSYLKESMPVCDERKFALETLPKTLEEYFGYKLCIFERDILSGGAVIDDVQSFIDRSRRLIIVLSKNYISDKVMFELEVGLHKALVERKIKVILIEYTPIKNFEFLPESLELLSSSQVLKWKEEKSLPLNSRFWKKLRCMMPAKPCFRNKPAVPRLGHLECQQSKHSTLCSGFP
uniref:Interleukin-18 receptor 1 isoform X1 n=2 Tax=Pogona vitticeps TaxID=103695 RepID=A0ABM5FYY2_9SAUR